MPSDGRPHVAVAVAVAADDAAGLPELELIEELAAGNAYLANEQLIEVVGGQGFFVLSPSSLFGSPNGSSYHSARILKMVASVDTISFGLAL